MFIQPHQVSEVLSPKKGCQRGLEEYIVEQHWGDKKAYNMGGNVEGGLQSSNPNAAHSYMYLNNPIYRVGKEGDPAPNGFSSRNYYQIGDYQPGFTETESTLHLLYPTIDSGSEFMYEKPWDMKWYYSRTNIPNMIGTAQDVEINNSLTKQYDDSVERKRASHVISDWMNRPLPIYDQNRINDEALPDGVRQIGLNDVVHDKAIPIVGNTPGKRQILEKGIENYTHTNLTGHNTSPSAGIGAYGYPQPYGYASVGDSRHNYDIFPGVVPGLNVEYYKNMSNSSPTGNNLMWICAVIFVGMLFLIIRKK